MLAWIRSPRGSTTTATVVAVFLALFWLAPWQKPLPVRLPFASPAPDAAQRSDNTSGLAQDTPGLRVPNDRTTGQVGGLADVGTASPSARAGAASNSVAGPAGAPASVVGTSGPALRGDAPSTGHSADAARSDTPSHDPGKASGQAAAVAAASSARTAGAGASVASLSGSAGPSTGPLPAGTAASTGSVTATVAGFDVVRVEPTGAAVIAGRAPPNSDVTLMDGDKAIGHVRADASGQFALLPDTLSAGSHYLTLDVRKPGESDAVRTAQGVAVSVAGDAAARPLVALLTPDKPAQVLSDGSALPAGAGKAVPAGVAAGTAPASVAIQTVEAGDGGKFTAAGVAHPGNQCRVYLNGAYLADVTANPDGRWSVEIQKGMRPGKYTVRADEVEPGSGKVLHRAEVPFDYHTAVAARPVGGAKRLLMSRAGEHPAAPLAGSALAPPPAASPLSATSHPSSSAAAVASLDPTRPDAPSTVNAARATPSAGLSVATAASPSLEEPSAAIIPDLQSATVTRGDSLWRISRKMLGHGVQYTEIYASNANQIRDPALIYPGQIFVVPTKKN